MKRFIILFGCSVFLLNCSTKKSESSEKSDSTTHTTPQTAVEVKSNKGPWQIFNVKDEFGDVIKGKSTIAADFKGKMSNSATANADLTVRMQVQDSTVMAAFYEYGREPQARLPESKFIKIRIKLNNGDVKTIQQFLYRNLMVDDKNELFKLLAQETSPFKVIVDLNTVDKYANTTYNFELDPTGFNEIITRK